MRQMRRVRGSFRWLGGLLRRRAQASGRHNLCAAGTVSSKLREQALVNTYRDCHGAVTGRSECSGQRYG